MREKLYEKISKEYEAYINNLKKETPTYIIDKSYETTIKEEITYLFDPNSRYFSDEQIKKLNKCEYPLDTLYDDWLKNDLGINDDIRESVNEYLSTLTYERKNKNKNKLER